MPGVVAEDHPGPRRKAEAVGARTQVAVGEAEVLRQGEGAVEVVAECQRGPGGEGAEEVGADSHPVEVGEEVVEVGQLHPPVWVAVVVLRAQLDPLLSANRRCKC